MKIYLLICVLIISIMSKGQAPIRSNTIVVSVKDTSFAYYKVSTSLKENGIRFSKYDKASRKLVSEPIVLTEATTINVIIEFKNNTEIYLRGNNFIPNIGITPIENLGMKGSPSELSWKELERISKLIGKKLIFLRDSSYVKSSE